MAGGTVDRFNDPSAYRVRNIVPDVGERDFFLQRSKIVGDWRMTTSTYGDRRRERMEFRCACGYGIVVSDEPPSCPMCQGNKWQPIPVRLEAA